MPLYITHPGGSGGHFIAQLCSHLLYNTNINISEQGDCHDITSRIFRFGIADTDLDYIENLDISLIHVQDLKTLEVLKGKTIYITLDSLEDIDECNKRLDRKVKKTKDYFSQSGYDLVRGIDWPSFEDVTDRDLNRLTKELSQMNLSHLNSWKYKQPTKTDKFLRIRFSELTNPKQIDRLSAFLEKAPTSREYLLNKLEEYEQRNRQMD